MKIKFLVPSLFTTFSLLSSLAAFGLVLEGKLVTSCWLIAAAMLFDGLDGKLARYLKATTGFGAIYDTLADFVAFGVVPALIIYIIFPVKSFLIIAVLIFYILMGAFRLVRFSMIHTDNDMSSKGNFTGLPIPAAAGAITSFIILNYGLKGEIVNFNLLLLLIPVISLLMVSRLVYFPVRFDDRSRKTGFLACGLIILALAVIVLLGYYFMSFFVLVYIYIFYGILRSLLLKVTGR